MESFIKGNYKWRFWEFDKYTYKKCGCYHNLGVDSNECLKRTFNVKNPVKGGTMSLQICNEWIRLNVSNNNLLINDAKQCALDVIEDIMLDLITETCPSFKVHQFWGGNTASIMDRIIYIFICESPKVMVKVKVSDAINCIINTESYGVSPLYERVLDSLFQWFNEKKNVKKYSKVLQLISKIKRDRHRRNNDSILTELFTEILKEATPPKKRGHRTEYYYQILNKTK